MKPKNTSSSSPLDDNLNLTEADLAKYIKSISLQIDVIGFVQSQIASKNPPPNRMLSIDLFGTDAQKVEIVEYLLSAYYFDLPIRLVQDFRLPVTTIYTTAMAKLAKKKLEPKILDMLKAIKGTLPDEDWDEVILRCIQIFAKEHSDVKTAEKFIARLSSEESKVDGYIICGKLKSAYIEAVKVNLVEKIRLIREEAITTDQTGVAQLCDKFLYLNEGGKEQKPVSFH